jgi:vacuolar-type H+-ATPase subunit E/Vma4
MTLAEELAPVHRAVLDHALADAERILADARAAAADHVARAERTAADILAKARESGALDARSGVAAQRRQVRKHARDGELAAQRAIYDTLTERVAAAVEVELGTPVAREALCRAVHDAVGQDATITELPGGVVGSVPGRRVELSARLLAQRGLSRCSARVRELWTS